MSSYGPGNIASIIITLVLSGTSGHTIYEGLNHQMLELKQVKTWFGVTQEALQVLLI